MGRGHPDPTRVTPGHAFRSMASRAGLGRFWNFPLMLPSTSSASDRRPSACSAGGTRQSATAKGANSIARLALTGRPIVHLAGVYSLQEPESPPRGSNHSRPTFGSTNRIVPRRRSQGHPPPKTKWRQRSLPAPSIVHTRFLVPNWPRPAPEQYIVGTRPSTRCIPQVITVAVRLPRIHPRSSRYLRVPYLLRGWKDQRTHSMYGMA